MSGNRWSEWLVGVAIIVLLAWLFFTLDSEKKPTRTLAPLGPPISQKPPVSEKPTACEALLADYGDPATPPIEDLRKIQHVAVGYFSIIKDSQRFPIGGNEDFSAALLGENPNREVFLRRENPIFSRDGLLMDRWGSPLVVHPLAWRQLEFRSAGPDRIPHNADDLVLAPNGNSSR